MPVGTAEEADAKGNPATEGDSPEFVDLVREAAAVSVLGPGQEAEPEQLGQVREGQLADSGG